jgi:hypothetical protein
MSTIFILGFITWFCLYAGKLVDDTASDLHTTAHIISLCSICVAAVVGLCVLGRLAIVTHENSVLESQREDFRVNLMESDSNN